MNHRHVRLAACGALVLLGLVVLAGWFTGIESLTAVVPGLSTMKVNTAICFVLVGTGLVAASDDRRFARRIAVGCGVAVAAIGVLTLFEYATAASLGIDELLVRDLGTLRGSGVPGRMSPLTASAWLALGPAIVLLALARRRRFIIAAHLLAVYAGFVAFLAAAGYAFGAEAFWGIGFYTAMAVHTAVGLMVAVAAALTTRLDEGWLAGFEEAAGARSLLLDLLPVALALPLLVGLAILFGSGLGAYNAEFGFAFFVPIMTLALAAVALRVVGRARTDELALRESEARQRAITEGTPECVKIVSADGRLLHINPAGLRMIEASALSDVCDSDAFELVAPEHREMWRGYHARVLAGESLSWEYDIIGLAGTRRSMETHAVPLRLPGGGVAHLATTRDVSERKQAEERQRLLINELNHRVKNTLAIVQSLAQQTFRGTDVPAQVRAAFESRLAALAGAHDLLTRESWEAASLHDVVRRAAAPAGGVDGRLRIEGPELRLSPRAAVSLTLAIHELTTNAMKYGALSDGDGRVSIVWRNGGDRLRLTWCEQDGPPVAPPSRRGFGSRLIERSLAADLGAEVGIDYRPEGLVCTIEAPLPLTG